MLIRVAGEGDLREGALQRFEVNGRFVTIVNSGGAVLAFDDACPHRGCSLAEDGEVRGKVLTCACHGSQFEVASGRVLQGPASEPLTMHVARVEGGSVLVEM